MDLRLKADVLEAIFSAVGKSGRPVQDVSDWIAAAVAGQVSLVDAVEILLAASNNNFQSDELARCLAPFAQAADGEKAAVALANAIAPYLYAEDERLRVNVLTVERVARLLPQKLHPAFVSAWIYCVRRVLVVSQKALSTLRLMSNLPAGSTDHLLFDAAEILLRALDIAVDPVGPVVQAELAKALSGDKPSRQAALLIVEAAPAKVRNAPDIIAALEDLARREYEESARAKLVLAAMTSSSSV